MVPAGEIGRVQTIQRIQTASAGLFFALAALGIVDSLRNYKHQVKRPTIKKIQELNLELEETKTTLVPFIGNNQAGAVFRMEF